VISRGLDIFQIILVISLVSVTSFQFSGSFCKHIKW